MSTRQAQLQAELEKARADLAGTVDELTGQLSPKAVAGRVTDSAKLAASDTAGLFRGDGFPHQRGRSRNVKVVLAAAGVVALVVLRMVLRRR